MKDIAKRVAAAKLVAEEIKGIEKEAKAELLEQCNKTGVRTIDLDDVDGEKLATVSKAKGKTSAKVNEAALLAWVKENRPDQLVEVVAPAYIEALKKTAIEHGAAVDETTGEVIPGVEVTTSDPSISTRPTAEARARMKKLLSGSGLLELAGGTGE